MKDVPISLSVIGRYKFQVLEKGVVVHSRPWEENMILNTFLDRVSTSTENSFGPIIRYHALGTGSAAVQATDTTLQNERRRTGTYFTGIGNTGSSWSGNSMTWRQTFDHAEEVSNVNYTEHGLSGSGVAGATVVTRALISGGTLTVLAGQQVRCVYDIVITVTPAVLTRITVGGTGWPVAPATDCDGYYIITKTDELLGSLLTSGVATNGSFLLGGSSKVAKAWTSMTISGFGTGLAGSPIGSSVSYTADTYTTGSFTRTFRPSAYVTPGAWSSTSVIGWTFNDVVSFKYDQAQTKANTHKLRYPSFTVTWSR